MATTMEAELTDRCDHPTPRRTKQGSSELCFLKDGFLKEGGSTIHVSLIFPIMTLVSQV